MLGENNNKLDYCAWEMMRAERDSNLVFEAVDNEEGLREDREIRARIEDCLEKHKVIYHEDEGFIYIPFVAKNKEFRIVVSVDLEIVFLRIEFPSLCVREEMIAICALYCMNDDSRLLFAPLRLDIEKRRFYADYSYMVDGPLGFDGFLFYKLLRSLRSNALRNYETMKNIALGKIASDKIAGYENVIAACQITAEKGQSYE